ncbi:glycoside hydrolase family 5 protein [Fomitiporia mediterranea MF3/22]|uniref:glycoside hydrolase family 5 protein n=1 Tax=Fomitiporia mediterranea (strain MF3/22) TaxID=694068 RepID=UPI00044073F9|nr:glycoside hydrolase family 5 protein [Fomitiporia mediterranea MF3/22]EJD05789.1 glycoside hydrolase family 5 protein [Fomitiporia mediterranea MF3/22]
MDEKRAAYTASRFKSRKLAIIGGSALLLVVIAAAVAIPLVLTKNKGNKDSSSSPGSDSGGSSGSGQTNPGSRVVTGGDGSKINMEDGTEFTYSNKFGGYWYFDPEDPFNNGARPQSWSPALNETFKYGIDIIRGVNLGGWLNTEPFITPALYERYLNSNPVAVDEWTLSQNMRADSANGGINQLEDHYRTFITEQDFAEIAGAGLNFVRIPLPYWAIETRGNEPFLAKTCWTYFLKAIEWARKYGLRINLDLHALPGSQNGWNHSGRLGTINMLNGPMGYANAQRSLDYIRILAEFISQPQYKDVVVMFGITNEPQASVVGQDQLSRYYLQSYDIVRKAGGTGTGNGPMISYHDGFLGTTNWAGFLPGADRIALDLHPYLAFGGQSADPVSSFVQTPCKAWGPNFNTSMSEFGLTAAGEYSNAITDCGLFVNGVNLGTRYEGTYPGSSTAVGSCDQVINWQSWSADLKEQYKEYAMASMDALQNWFFWTWKIGNSSTTNTVMAPHWSYKLGLDNGWMPLDPRDSVGKCGGAAPFNGPLAPSATGGSGADTIPTSVLSSLAWPPATISAAGPVTALPSYTPTGAVPTLPAPTFTATSGKSVSTASAGSGWQNPSDNAGLMTDAAGCNYLDPWVGPTAALPVPLCGAAAATKRAEVTGVPIRR